MCTGRWVRVRWPTRVTWCVQYRPTLDLALNLGQAGLCSGCLLHQGLDHSRVHCGGGGAGAEAGEALVGLCCSRGGAAAGGCEATCAEDGVVVCCAVC